MKCFYHHENDALGLCKNCGKGLCSQCVVDIGDGLACPGRCEEQVRANNELMQRSRKSFSTAGTIYTGTGGSTIILGLIFFALDFGLVSQGLLPSNRLLRLFLLGIGLLLFVGGIGYLIAGKKIVTK